MLRRRSHPAIPRRVFIAPASSNGKTLLDGPGCLRWRGPGPEARMAFLELKWRGSGRLSESQEAMRDHLEACEFDYCCTDSVEAAIAMPKAAGILRRSFSVQ